MNKKSVFTDCLWLILIGIGLYGLFLGSYHLITPDEGRYPEIAREMARSGNLITPHLNGITFLDKPILYYWAESLIIHFFGVSEWSIRLLPAFFGIIGSVINYLAGRMLFNRRTGWLSALVLMTSLIYFLSSHYADMDLMVSVLLSGALWLFIMAVKLPNSNRKRDIYLWCAYIFAALAFLTKGLLGIVFPAMIIGLWIIFTNQWKQIRHMRLISGALIFLVIVMPWMILVQQENPEFLHYFFVVQQLSRFLSSNFNMSQPFYFYVPVLVLGFLPWIIFLPQAFITNWRSHHNLTERLVQRYLLIWPVSIFIFFSIPSSKIIGYLLPIFPPVAMMVAYYLSSKWDDLPDKRSMHIAAFVFLIFAFLMSIGLLVAANMPSITSDTSMVYLVSMAFVLLLGAVFCVGFAYQKRSMRWILSTILLSTVITWITAVAAIHTFKLNNIKPLALLINQKIHSGDRVITFQKYYQDLPIYIHRRIYVVADWQNPNIIQNDNWKRELAEDVLYKHKQASWLIDEKTLLADWKDPKHRAFLLTSRSRVDMVRKVLKDLPVYKLGQYDKVVLLSNRKFP